MYQDDPDARTQQWWQPHTSAGPRLRPEAPEPYAWSAEPVGFDDVTEPPGRRWRWLRPVALVVAGAGAASAVAAVLTFAAGTSQAAPAVPPAPVAAASAPVAPPPPAPTAAPKGPAAQVSPAAHRHAPRTRAAHATVPQSSRPPAPAVPAPPPVEQQSPQWPAWHETAAPSWNWRPFHRDGDHDGRRHPDLDHFFWHGGRFGGHDS